MESIGDFNGDGQDDIAIIEATWSGLESVHIFYGGTRHQGTVWLDDSDASFAIESDDDGNYHGVTGPGDFNGDGYDDLIVGVSGADDGATANAGKVYVVYGNGR